VSTASRAALLGSLLVYSGAGVAYELLLAGFAGYVLGESLALYCAVIGLFLSCMGLGAHLSRRLGDPPGDAYALLGAALAVCGASAPAAILAVAAHRAHVELAVALGTVACGTLTGLAIPLCARLAAGKEAQLSRLIALVLALDYLGALAGSLALPAIVLPGGGYLRGAAILGAATWLAALAAAWGARRASRRRALVIAALLAALLPVLGLALHGTRLLDWAMARVTGERILHREHSPYQEILLSEGRAGLGLRLNGRVQFQERWERRYHEALVHPAFSLAARRREILVLGGGDGLPLREILRYAEVTRTVLVDLDPRMVQLARSHPRLVELNQGSLSDPRVEVVHDDAFLWVERSPERFDVVVVDLPVPVSLSLSKLYSAEFYRNAGRRLAEGGILAVQSTAFDASRARVLWCIGRSLEAAGLVARPYLLGRMGYHLAAKTALEPDRIRLRVETQFLTDAFARSLFVLPRDLGPVPVEVNRLENHAILRYMR
jgi:spermidine synthase